MKVLWVFAHPEPRSLNASLRDHGVACLEAESHEVRQSDLYAMNWKAVADQSDFDDWSAGDRFNYADASLSAFRAGTQSTDVVDEQEKINWADTILIQFPLWWYAEPAILKGWFDRVLAAGWIHRVPDPANPGRSLRFGEGNLKGKRGLLIVTTGSPAASIGPRGVAGDIQELLFRINYGVFWFSGMSVLRPHVIHEANKIDEARFLELSGGLGERLLGLDRESPIPYRAQNSGDYDDDLVLKPDLAPGLSGHALRTRKS